jgi:protein YIPF5/7
MHFGNIYGIGLSGCTGICLLINLLMRKGGSVDLYTTISILGYSLVPFVFLAATSLFVDLINTWGFVFCLFVIGWSTITATRLFEHCLDMQDQKYLIAYPIFLFYGVFLLLAIF